MLLLNDSGITKQKNELNVYIKIDLQFFYYVRMKITAYFYHYIIEIDLSSSNSLLQIKSLFPSTC